MTTERENEKIATQDEMEGVKREDGIVIGEEGIVMTVAWQDETHDAKTTTDHQEEIETYSQTVWIVGRVGVMLGAIAGVIGDLQGVTGMNSPCKQEERVRVHHRRRKNLHPI